jgi:ribosome-associated toxin RatA of RatAB toxin-antitoxin module
VSQLERSAYVNYSCEQMFDLVNDVRMYPQFLPGCIHSELVSESDSEIVATLEVGKGPIKQSFTTRNTLHKADRIEMVLVKGPFKRLQGVWTFTPLDESSCKIALVLDFELNGMLKVAFGGIFSQVGNAMVDAFSQRAKVVYGE